MMEHLDNDDIPDPFCVYKDEDTNEVKVKALKSSDDCNEKQIIPFALSIMQQQRLKQSINEMLYTFQLLD